MVFLSCVVCEMGWPCIRSLIIKGETESLFNYLIGMLNFINIEHNNRFLFKEKFWKAISICIIVSISRTTFSHKIALIQR